MSGKNRIILPLLLVLTMLIGLAGITNAAVSCATTCDDGTTIAGLSACNATITQVAGEGNWTKPALFFYSSSTSNSSSTVSVLNYTNATVWTNSSDYSPGAQTLNLTFDSTQVGDAPDYSAYMVVYNVSNNAKLTCSTLTSRIVNNGIPVVAAMTSLGSNAGQGANSVTFTIANATSYVVRVNGDVMKSRTTVTGTFTLASASATLSQLPNSGNWTVEVTDGTDVVNYGSTFTLGGYSKGQTMVREQSGVGAGIPLQNGTENKSRNNFILIALATILGLLLAYWYFFVKK